jgi:hypothetical protein
MRRNNGSSSGYGHPVEKVTTGDVAMHSEIFVLRVSHDFPYLSLVQAGSANHLRLRISCLIGLADCDFRALKSNLAVGSITKGFVDGSAAAAKRKCRLASQIKLVSVGVNQFD